MNGILGDMTIKEFFDNLHSMAEQMSNDKVGKICETCPNKDKHETLIIVGTEQYYTNPANKLMFMGQAVRQVRQTLQGQKNVKILVFTDGYTSNQLAAFDKAVKSYNDEVKIEKITNKTQLINFINYGEINAKATDDSERKIKSITIYSHGTIGTKGELKNEGTFAFGYHGTNAYNQQVSIFDFKKINKAVFLEDNKTHLYSYACRTGIGVSDFPRVEGDPMKSNSLAQKIANYGKITVHAYMRRSNYEDTWGADEHRRTYSSDNDNADGVIDNLKYDIYDLTHGDPSDMQQFTDYMKTKTTVDGFPWNAQGAFLPVGVGTRPFGPKVSTRYETYYPNKNK